MTTPIHEDPHTLVDVITKQLSQDDLAAVAESVADIGVVAIVEVLERLPKRQAAVVYRLLTKDVALSVFESLPASLQGDLVSGLQDSDVARLFAQLEPDDRVALLDELPASVAPKLLRGLPAVERDLTAVVLGYPQGCIGRRMSPEYVSTHSEFTAAQTLARIKERLHDAETVYTIPVLDQGRRVVGVVSLRDLLAAQDDETVDSFMKPAYAIEVTVDAELAARRCADLGLLALPIVDKESRLVGILTIDDAVRILEEEESEDSARQGGVEPLRRPYLTTPISTLVRSRVVWLLVLALGATLTVQVLEVFESTLEQVTVLALFVPLLIGTGGNTGNQAATTVTRALALNEVRPKDLLAVISRELRVGASLGIGLGLIGFLLAGLVYDFEIGTVIGLTLLAICTVAATIGGVMPLLARAVRADPAVFSNPFITTFVDATGLVIYFLIAAAVLGL